MLTKAKNKKGISIMVLVITIIVLSILAATVITSLSSTNVISEASRNVLKSNLTTMQDIATTYMVKNYDSVDMKREYSITEFGITDERFKEYETISVVKAGKVYIKSNAPENVQEVAQELNMLIDGVISNTGNVTLARTATSLRIYGNSVENTTTNVIQSVGERTKNLFNMNEVLPEQGWVKKQDGSFYVQSARTPYEEKLWENTEEYTGQIKILVKLKYLYSSSENPYTGSSIRINYTDGTVDYCFAAPITWNADTWINVDFVTSASKTVSYIDWSYGTGANSTWVKDIVITKDTTITEYEPYGYKIPVTMTGKNLFDGSFPNSGSYLSTNKFNGEKLAVSITDKDTSTDITGLYLAFASDTVYPFTKSQYIIIDSDIRLTQTTSTELKYLLIYPATQASINKINARFNIQVEIGNSVTPYEPYNGQTYNIYLSEPLRKVSNTADYIDCTTGEVVRKVRVKDATGTKNIVESFELLKTPIKENITIENMNFTDKKHIFVETSVAPSRIEVKY